MSLSVTVFLTGLSQLLDDRRHPEILPEPFGWS
jgi:hypothetical protein